MRSLFAATTLALSAGLGAFAQGSGPVVASLKTAATANERLNILKDDSNFVFDFSKATPAKGAGGQAFSANVANFPALTGQGLAMTIGWLGKPCGMNTPHTHPRATEMLYLINGTIAAGMLNENGARFVYNEIQANSAAVFVKGSIHYQINLGCEPVQFVAALSNEDPGVLSVAQRYFGLPPDVVAASLGDLGVVQVAGLEAMIPDNFAFGVQQCLDRCKIDRGQQPTNQRQPRVAANALPSGFSGPPPPSPAPSPRDVLIERRAVFDAVPAAEVVQPARPEVQLVTTAAGQYVNLALVALVGMMALGYVSIALMYARNRGPAQYAAMPPVERYVDQPRMLAPEKAAL